MTDRANSSPGGTDDGIFEVEGQPFTESRELGKMATLIAGVAVGAMIGAGAALLLAPGSGDETRTAIKRRVRKLTKRERGVWKSLAGALAEAANETAARSKLQVAKASSEVAAVRARV
ncbi:MAG: YtxH domain-containing protein [Gemmatimonadaceae bacterium]|nr:YtxH domain-containing protein [Gemmatimonadaceae bacterium]